MGLRETYRKLLDAYPDCEFKRGCERLWKYHEQKGDLDAVLQKDILKSAAKIGDTPAAVEQTFTRIVDEAHGKGGNEMVQLLGCIPTTVIDVMQKNIDALPEQDPETGEFLEEPVPTREELEQKMKDPRYWRDPEFRAEVTRGFERLTQAQASGEGQAEEQEAGATSGADASAENQDQES